ncbi:MAG: DUF2157 domain-containing protein [Desulfofustis sp.]|nr:DUF2157 domain-containing protein [Desulfofustis sp.]
MRLLRFFKKDMAREVSDWVHEGLIEPAQAEAILEKYGTKMEDADDSSLGYFMLMALAVLFVGLALILIVSHNWEKIPRLTRMLGLLFVTLAVNLQGMRLMLLGRETVGIFWLFFGSICYGTTIMLIAQIYHIGEYFPDGIFYWSIGVLPLIFVTRSRQIALLCLALATIWALVEIQSKFFPASYPFFMISGIWLALIRRDSALLFLIGLAGLIFWANMLLAWIGGEWYTFEAIVDQIPGTITLGLLLAGFSWVLMRHSDSRLNRYGQILYLWLLRGVILLLFVLSFSDVWRELSNETYLLGLFTPLMMLLIGLTAFFIAKPSGSSACGPILINVIFFFSSFLWLHVGNVNEVWLAVVTNLMLLMTGLWLIRRGIEDSTTQFFYTGVGVLLLTALLRYFDLIGDYIGGAILFIVAAAVLFGAARYWRSQQLKKEEANV